MTNRDSRIRPERLEGLLARAAFAGALYLMTSGGGLATALTPGPPPTSC